MLVLDADDAAQPPVLSALTDPETAEPPGISSGTVEPSAGASSGEAAPRTPAGAWPLPQAPGPAA